MSHNEVHEQFESRFPQYLGNCMDTWFPNGKNSIRVRQVLGQEYVFTYNGPTDWRLETKASFLKNMKGNK